MYIYVYTVHFESRGVNDLFCIFIVLVLSDITAMCLCLKCVNVNAHFIYLIFFVKYELILFFSHFIIVQFKFLNSINTYIILGNSFFLDFFLFLFKETYLFFLLKKKLIFSF